VVSRDRNLRNEDCNELYVEVKKEIKERWPEEWKALGPIGKKEFNRVVYQWVWSKNYNSGKAHKIRLAEIQRDLLSRRGHWESTFFWEYVCGYLTGRER